MFVNDLLVNLMILYTISKHFLDKILEGEKNILTAKNPQQIGVTSGTSGKSSLLPTTADVSRMFATRGVFVAMHTMFDAYPGVRNNLLSTTYILLQ